MRGGSGRDAGAQEQEEVNNQKNANPSTDETSGGSRFALVLKYGGRVPAADAARLFFSLWVAVGIFAPCAQGTAFAGRLSGGAHATAMIDQPVVRAAPLALRDVLHELMQIGRAHV